MVVQKTIIIVVTRLFLRLLFILKSLIILFDVVIFLGHT